MSPLFNRWCGVSASRYGALVLAAAWCTLVSGRAAAEPFLGSCHRYRVPIDVTTLSAPPPGAGTLVDVVIDPTTLLASFGEVDPIALSSLRVAQGDTQLPIEVVSGPAAAGAPTQVVVRFVVPGTGATGSHDRYDLYADTIGCDDTPTAPGPLLAWESVHTNPNAETLSANKPAGFTTYHSAGSEVLSALATDPIQGAASARMATGAPAGSELHALLAAAATSNGTVGATAWPALHATTYRVAFWARAVGAPVWPRLLTWKSAAAPQGDRVFKTLSDPLTTSGWHYYQKEATTNADSERLAPYFQVTADATTGPVTVDIDGLVLAPKRIKVALGAVERRPGLGILNIGLTRATSGDEDHVLDVAISDGARHQGVPLPLVVTVNGVVVDDEAVALTGADTLHVAVAFDPALVGADGRLTVVATLDPAGLGDLDPSDDAFHLETVLRAHPSLYFDAAALDRIRANTQSALGAPIWSALAAAAQKAVLVPWGGFTPSDFQKVGSATRSLLSATMAPGHDPHGGAHAARLDVYPLAPGASDSVVGMTFVEVVGGVASPTLPRLSADGSALRTYTLSFWARGEGARWFLRTAGYENNAAHTRHDAPANETGGVGAGFTPTPEWQAFTTTITLKADCGATGLACPSGVSEPSGAIFLRQLCPSASCTLPAWLEIDDVVISEGGVAKWVGDAEGEPATDPNAAPLANWDADLRDTDTTAPWAGIALMQKAADLANAAEQFAFIDLMAGGQTPYGTRALEYLSGLCRLTTWTPLYYRSRGQATHLETGHLARPLASVYDWMYGAMNEPARQAARDCFRRLAIGPAHTDLTNGYFQHPINNWVAVIDGSAALAALATLGDDPLDPGWSADLPALRTLVRGYFATTFDANGGYAEGLGYAAYAMNAGGAGYLAAIGRTGLEDPLMDTGAKNAWRFPMAVAPRFAVTMLAPKILNVVTGAIATSAAFYGTVYAMSYGDGPALDNDYPSSVLALLAATTRDPAAVAYHQANVAAAGSDGSLFELIWYDPSIMDAATAPAEDPLRAVPTELAFPAAGILTSRESWAPDAQLVSWRAGPYVGAHTHADQLSFQVFAGGEPLIIDAGVGNYQSLVGAAYYDQLGGHNTLMLDGDPGSQVVGASCATTTEGLVAGPTAALWHGDAAVCYTKPGMALRRAQRDMLFAKGAYLAFSDDIAAAGGASVLPSLRLHGFDRGHGQDAIGLEAPGRYRVRGTLRDAVAVVLAPAPALAGIAAERSGPMATNKLTDQAFADPTTWDQWTVAWGPTAPVTQLLMGTVLFIVPAGAAAPEVAVSGDAERLAATFELPDGQHWLFFSTGTSQGVGDPAEVALEARYGNVVCDADSGALRQFAYADGLGLTVDGVRRVDSDDPIGVVGSITDSGDGEGRTEAWTLAVADAPADGTELRLGVDAALEHAEVRVDGIVVPAWRDASGATLGFEVAGDAAVTVALWHVVPSPDPEDGPESGPEEGPEPADDTAVATEEAETEDAIADGTPPEDTAPTGEETTVTADTAEDPSTEDTTVVVEDPEVVTSEDTTLVVEETTTATEEDTADVTADDSMPPTAEDTTVVVDDTGVATEDTTAVVDDTVHEVEAATESESEAESEVVTEPEVVTESESEAESEVVTEPEVVTESEAEAEAVTEPESEAVTEPEPVTESESVTESEPESPPAAAHTKGCTSGTLPSLAVALLALALRRRPS